MEYKKSIDENIKYHFSLYQDENGAWLDDSGLSDTNVEYDVIVNGLIYKTFKTAPNMDIAKLTQSVSERMGLNIKTFHLCNLRHKK